MPSRPSPSAAPRLALADVGDEALRAALVTLRAWKPRSDPFTEEHAGETMRVAALCIEAAILRLVRSYFAARRERAEKESSDG